MWEHPVDDEGTSGGVDLVDQVNGDIADVEGDVPEEDGERD